ncbi:hypothetical protein HID58_060912, partial [Brassica napus]
TWQRVIRWSAFVFRIPKKKIIFDRSGEKKKLSRKGELESSRYEGFRKTRFSIDLGFRSFVVRMTNPHEPHFLKPLLPGFHSGIHIERKTNQKTWKLRSDASDKIWEVIQEGMRLTGGWKDFATAHDLRIGDIVIFKHEGDIVFHVTPFGPSCCEIQYTDPDINKEEADAGDADDNEI